MPLTLDRPPKTILEVYRMLPEGTRAELINGRLYMSPAPLLEHQRIIVSLTSSMNDFVRTNELGEVLVSPVDVYLNQKNVYQPDIVFISKANASILKEDGIYGAPDLVIEVLSPGMSRTDLTKKKSVYEKEGVKEYWVVDHKSRLARGFRLSKGKFSEFKKENRKVSSALLKQVFRF